MRADAVRYIYMYKYGGFYADLDVECLASHVPLAQCGGVLMPLMSDDYSGLHNVPNAWLASEPGHPFWLFVLTRILHDERPNSPEAVTGPVQLIKSLKAYNAQKCDPKGEFGGVRYVEPGLIFPYDRNRQNGLGGICSAQSSGFSEQECKEKLKVSASSAYSITYWSHSWADESALKNLHKERR